MPTLFRLLLFLMVLSAVAYGGMLAMVTYMEPHAHPITQNVTIPGSRR